MYYFNSRMYTDCKIIREALIHLDKINFNSRMYTDCKNSSFLYYFLHLLISTRACTRIARAWNKSQTLSGPVLFLSRASCKIPISKEYTRCFAQIMVSCWTYFLPGFCRAVPVISTPALLSLGRSKRTRLCCYPIL